MRNIILVVLLFASCLAVTAQNFDTITIKTTKVAGSVYMLEGSGGNIGVLVGNDGVILIDDQFAPLSEKIKKAIAAISDKPIRFIINTHFHGDHSDGNKVFGSEGSIIVAHENVRKRLSTDYIFEAFKQEQKALSYEGLPKITFAESLTFNMNGETVQVIHIKNAHTDGDAAIYFKESNVLHTGDAFVRYGLPFIDDGGGGTLDGMIKGADQMLKMINDETKIIPGHGQISSKKDLQDYKNKLQTIRNRIAEGIKAGKTVDQIISSDPTKEFKTGFDKVFFVQSVYKSLKK
ncbi:MAG TPA: MBL fold metallo-hydrolase [Chitinophagaceae bacterium]|jgi:glyoxylase-like metal-dependent hydrolase (beta-lactamase superfamily II)|nr:MBL fold metallo-hydrolase [Chitinophagaceae bacterium]